jgi:WD40 repeat protein
MSKQLLHSHSSNVIVTGLNHRAFAVVSSSSDQTFAQNAFVYELMAPSSKPSAAADATKSDENDKSGDKPSDDNEIQAVCCTEIDSCLWFAVSRGVKTLSLYSIPAKKNTEGDSEETTKLLYPSAIYNLPKRAKCLAFTSVEDLQLIIAGDLSGDAIAFAVPTTDSQCSTSNESEEAVKPTSTPNRLLLGHTASVLTGLNVVSSSNNQQQFILTADRDEKVRVSYFPETHIIHGYLLGHSSFISCMDSISNERSLCLTASGDGTSRLWDYQTCKEVGMLPVVIKKSTEEKRGDMEEDEDEAKSAHDEEEDEIDEDLGGKEGDDDFDEDFDEEEEEEESFDSHTVAVPLSVALHPDAKYAAVARDEIQSIDIHPIPPVAEKSTLSTSFQLSNFVSLHKKQTLECKSQPLAVRFTSDSSVLVLAREPDYLLHFSTNDDDDATSFTDVSESSCFTKALRQVAQSENITMPITTLERDSYGECMLQKKEDRKELTAQQNTEKGGLHWNDPGRKVTAKMRQARKRQRKMERKRGEGGKQSNEEASN